MGFSDAINDGTDDLDRFDTAGGGDLAGFDDATGVTHVPAGWYSCAIVRGELVTTKAGKPAYRLTLDVAAGPHQGFRLWRYYTLDTPAAMNRAKAALAPLGLRTTATLRAPFPGTGRAVMVKVLVAVQTRPDGTTSNDVQRFEVTDDRTAPPNPNAVDLDAPEGGTA